MPITSVIAHRLVKSSPTSQCDIRLRGDTLALNGKSEELCRELKNTYVRKAGKMYGCFSENTADYPIKPLIMEFLEEKIPFLSLSKQILNQIKLRLDPMEVALDVHVVLFYEKIEAGDALYVVLLQHSTGQYLDGDLELCDALYLDTQDIVLAAKVKIPELLENQQQNYLSILRWRGEKDVSDAFAETFGFANKVDVAADTSQFLELVTHYTQDLPEKEAKEARSHVVDFCLERDKSGDPIKLTDLSSQISHGDKPSFTDYVKQTNAPIPQELIPDKTQLRNYVRISGRNEQLSMSFASDCLGNSVMYDAASDSLIIKDIPAGLKSKLVSHLRKNLGEAEGE